MKTGVMIAFPLVVMFLITTINVGSYEESADLEFYGTREVAENIENEFIGFITQQYDDRTTPPWLFWYGDFFITDFQEELDKHLGTDSNHFYTATLMLDTINEQWEDNADRIDNTTIVYVVERDPKYLEEWWDLREATAELDPVILYIGMFAGIMLLVGIIGLRIFGSGLSGASIQAIITLSILFLLWGIMSALSYNSLLGIPEVGVYLWTFLTFIYAVGAFLTVTGNDGDD